jgi:hypothetical protein
MESNKHRCEISTETWDCCPISIQVKIELHRFVLEMAQRRCRLSREKSHPWEVHEAIYKIPRILYIVAILGPQHPRKSKQIHHVLHTEQWETLAITMIICDDMWTFRYGKNVSKISVKSHNNALINELIVAHYYIRNEIFSRVYGCVTKNNGFWIGCLDLLTPSFTIPLNHNQFTTSQINLQPNPSSLTAEDSLHFRSRSTTDFWVWVWVLCYDRRSVGQSILV